MKNLLASLALVGLLTAGGCASLKAVVSGTTTVPTSKIVAAASGVDTAQQLAASYIAYCTPVVQPVGCSNTAIVKMIPAVRSVRAARNAAEHWVVANPSATVGPASLISAITAANGALSTVEAQYDVSSTIGK